MHTWKDFYFSIFHSQVQLNFPSLPRLQLPVLYLSCEVKFKKNGTPTRWRSFKQSAARLGPRPGPGVTKLTELPLYCPAGIPQAMATCRSEGR